MFRTLYINAFIILAMFLFSACGRSQMEIVEDIEKSFIGIDEIKINGGFLEVNYEGRESDQEVFLNAFLESNQQGSYEIKYSINGKKLIVELQRNGGIIGLSNIKTTGFISLTGPEDVKLSITNGSGRMHVSNVTNKNASFKCSSGRIELKNLMVDNINIKASSGNIHGSLLGGNVNCSISSGSVNLEKVDGNVTIKGSSGRFNVKEVQGIVNSTMSSGSVSLENIRELGSVTLSSGKIKGTGVGLGPDTYLKASSGSISIQTDDELQNYNFNLSASSGSLNVGNHKGKKVLNIDNQAEATVRGAISSGKISISN